MRSLLTVNDTGIAIVGAGMAGLMTFVCNPVPWLHISYSYCSCA